MVFKHCRQNSNNLQILNKLESIAESKYNYNSKMADKLNIIPKISKAYWSLLKQFLNK